MEIKSAYRLHSYRITEYETGLLWWETHFDFGRLRGGECFIHGNTLILKPWSEDKHGALIGEFLDPLKKLPLWRETPYYCFASELLEVKTGRKLPPDFLKHRPSFLVNPIAGPKTSEPLPPGQYRIDRYRITVNADLSIFWQAPGGVNRIIGGKARIESDILCLGPQAGQEVEQNKQEFVYQLSALPLWSATRVWCRHSALRFCGKEESPGLSPIISPTVKESGDPKPPGFQSPSPGKISRGSPLREAAPDPVSSPSSPTFFPSLFRRPNRSKKAEPGSSQKKSWLTLLILVVITGLIVAAVVAFHSLKKKRYRLPWIKKYHHEDRHDRHSRSGVKILLTLFFLIILRPLAPVYPVNALERDFVLEDSGIHYPGGFDLNTFGEIQGKAVHLSRPVRGPIRFLLTSDRGTYTVLTSPHWFWHKIKVNLPEGSEVIVSGSKSFGMDGKLYIVAQEIRVLSSGEIYAFRDKNGLPLWKKGLRSEMEPSRRYRGGYGGQNQGHR